MIFWMEEDAMEHLKVMEGIKVLPVLGTKEEFVHVCVFLESTRNSVCALVKEQVRW